jgi:hypothetical protein
MKIAIAYDSTINTGTSNVIFVYVHIVTINSSRLCPWGTFRD